MNNNTCKTRRSIRPMFMLLFLKHLNNFPKSQINTWCVSQFSFVACIFVPFSNFLLLHNFMTPKMQGKMLFLSAHFFGDTKFCQLQLCHLSSHWSTLLQTVFLTTNSPSWIKKSHQSAIVFYFQTIHCAHCDSDENGASLNVSDELEELELL